MVFDVNFGHGKRTRRPKSWTHGLVETDEGVSKRTTNRSGAERMMML